jgi:hypothetical protein
LSGKEYARVCDEVLSAVEEYESATPVQAIPRDILFEKHKANVGKGLTFKQNNPVCAIEYTEKGIEVLLQMGRSNNDVLVLEANTFIAEAKTKLPDVDKKAALKNLLQHQNHLHTLYKAEYDGEDDPCTLMSESGLATTLVETDQFSEAKNLLESLYTPTCRVHGPNHLYTKGIEELLKLAMQIIQSLEI